MERKSAYETQSQRNCCKTTGQILRDNICTLFNLLNLLIAIALIFVHAWSNLFFVPVVALNTIMYCTGTESQAADRKADAFVPVECQNRTERRTALCSHCRSAGTGYSAPGKRQPDLRRCRCHRRRHRGQRVPAHRRIGCSLQKGRRFPAVRQFCYQRHLPCHCPPCGQ